MIKETLKIMPIYISTNDAVLINNIKNGNQVNDSFVMIYKKYFNDIKMHLNSRSQGQIYLHASLDDIIQESFIKLFENINNGKYEHGGTLNAYIKKIAWNLFLKEFRKKDTPIDDDDNDPDDDLGYGNGSLDSIYLRAAEIAFEKLNNEICKDIILLRIYNGLSDIEIFEMNPILKNVQNVKNRRNKCFDKLKKLCLEILIKEDQKNN